MSLLNSTSRDLAADRVSKKKKKEFDFISITFQGRGNIQKIIRKKMLASLMKEEMAMKMLRGTDTKK